MAAAMQLASRFPPENYPGMPWSCFQQQEYSSVELFRLAGFSNKKIFQKFCL